MNFEKWKKNKGTIIFLSIAAAVLIYFICYHVMVIRAFSQFTPTYEQIVIHNAKINETVYLKKKIWGLLGNGQVKVLSLSSDEEFEPNDSLEYIYPGMSPLFFNLIGDTIHIYTYKASPLPKHWPSTIKVNQVELHNVEMMNLRRYHNEEGLSMFE